MTWSSTGYVIAAAKAARWTAVAFAISDLRRTRFAIGAAEAAGVPAIVEVTAEAAEPGGAIPYWVDEARVLAEAAHVPIALHLAAPPSRGLMRRAAQAGFSSVRNLARGGGVEPDIGVIRRAAFWAHENGLLVEVRFGRIGSSGADAARPGVRGCGALAGPGLAARFVASTEIDLLSVGLGGPGAQPHGAVGIDPTFIARLCDALPVPLALHGATTCPPTDLLGAEGCQGVVKVDIAATTEAECVRAYLPPWPEPSNSASAG